MGQQASLACFLALHSLPTFLWPGFPCRGASLEAFLLHDSVTAQLMDPDFANDAVQFMELQVRCSYSYVHGVCDCCWR